MYYHFINSEYPNGCVRESKVEKPEPSLFGSAGYYGRKIKKWHSQLSTPIKCTSPLGENGILVEEGKDFEFSQFMYCQNEIEFEKRCNNQCNHCAEYYKPLEDEMRVAVPPLKEDESLWNNVVATVAAANIMGSVKPEDVNGIEKWKLKVIKTLKSKYSITRKVNQ